MHSITYCEGFVVRGFLVFFVSCRLLKVAYYVIICAHISSTFSASSSEVREPCWLHFERLTPSRASVEHPQGSVWTALNSSACLQYQPLIAPHIPATATPTRRWRGLGKQPRAAQPLRFHFRARWVQVPWDEFNCKYSE